MPLLPEDFRPKAIIALSSCNALSVLGATDTIWSDNPTVAGVQNAIRALPLLPGTADDLQEIVAIGIQHGVDAGVIGATHGFTSLAGAITAVHSYIPDYDRNFMGYLYQ